MARHLWLLALAALLLAGCGDASSSTAPSGEATISPSSRTPTASSPTSSPTPDPSGVLESRGVVLVHATGGGGAVATTATRLPDAAAVAAYGADLSPGLAAQVRTTATRIFGADGGYAQVVAVGCDVPPSAVVTGEGSTVTVEPADIVSPLQECYAAVTTVAVVTAS